MATFPPQVFFNGVWTNAYDVLVKRNGQWQSINSESDLILDFNSFDLFTQIRDRMNHNRANTTVNFDISYIPLPAVAQTGGNKKYGNIFSTENGMLFMFPLQPGAPILRIDSSNDTITTIPLPPGIFISGELKASIASNGHVRFVCEGIDNGGWTPIYELNINNLSIRPVIFIPGNPTSLSVYDLYHMRFGDIFLNNIYTSEILSPIRGNMTLGINILQDEIFSFEPGRFTGNLMPRIKVFNNITGAAQNAGMVNYLSFEIDKGNVITQTRVWGNVGVNSSTNSFRNHNVLFLYNRLRPLTSVTEDTPPTTIPDHNIQLIGVSNFIIPTNLQIPRIIQRTIGINNTLQEGVTINGTTNQDCYGIPTPMPDESLIVPPRLGGRSILHLQSPLLPTGNYTINQHQIPSGIIEGWGQGGISATNNNIYYSPLGSNHILKIGLTGNFSRLSFLMTNSSFLRIPIL